MTDEVESTEHLGNLGRLRDTHLLQLSIEALHRDASVRQDAATFPAMILQTYLSLWPQLVVQLQHAEYL